MYDETDTDLPFNKILADSHFSVGDWLYVTDGISGRRCDHYAVRIEHGHALECRAIDFSPSCFVDRQSFTRLIDLGFPPRPVGRIAPLDADYIELLWLRKWHAEQEQVAA